MIRTNQAINELKIKMHPFDRVANANNDESSVREWHDTDRNENAELNIREFHWRDILFWEPLTGDLPVEYTTSTGEIGKCQSHYLGELDDCRFWRPCLTSLNAQYIDKSDVQKALDELTAVDIFSKEEGIESGLKNPINTHVHGISDEELDKAISESEVEICAQSDPETSHYFQGLPCYVVGNDPFDENYVYVVRKSSAIQKAHVSEVYEQHEKDEAEKVRAEFHLSIRDADLIKMIQYIKSM
ncbi:hypothetical protein VPFG_00308 [Vibrio phage nt-1]|uniref:Uncharacterized protein n=1 Tax=Vibrio phage nt-1 TaxID=115992 RepID=R9TJM5_9CAUD|nr:hypothetical protein VPFG_00308 [Vibrio phage nt-1]AGN30307.1 hypothetical protein VPFG_00308 [Vibrio phage nt-1]